MKNKYLFLFLPMLLLSSCGGPTPNVEPEPHDWLDERDYTYENMIEKPSDVVHNIEDLRAICDYYAFYKVGSFSVTPAKDYEYSVEGKKDLFHELNYLYWHTELINGVMGMDAKEKQGKWNFVYTFYHNAHQSDIPYVQKGHDIFSQDRVQSVREKETFATDDESKPVADVATTQQLFYAAEHGYRVNPIANSPAETYYNMSKTYLNSILTDGMDEFDTFTTIYENIAQTISYDYQALDDPEAPNPDLYPDVYAAQHKCYFIEGFFDDRLSVCDGYGKILTLFSRMEGIEIVRAAGTSDVSYDSRYLPGHAYTFVNIEDQWYLSDITWGNVNYYGIEAVNHDFMLSYHHAIDPYSSTMWPEIQSEMKQYKNSNKSDLYGFKERYFSKFDVSYKGQTVSRIVNKDNVELLCEYLKDEFSKPGNSYADILIQDKEAYSYLAQHCGDYSIYLPGTYSYTEDSLEIVILNWSN